jgi:MFS family permease
MVQFSGPYFTPYMLKHLSFSYAAFVALFSASFIAKALSMTLWGWFARRHGARSLLWTGAISIVPLASLWNVSDSFAWLLLVQAASGAAWAAYELGFFLMFFDTLPNHQRTKMLTVYNLANTSAWFCGSLLGGWYLTACGATPAAYQTIFAVSTLGRCAALLLLWNVDRPLLVPCSLFLRSVYSNVMAIMVREKSFGEGAMESTIYAFTRPGIPQPTAATSSSSHSTQATVPLTSIPLPVSQMMPDSDGLSDNTLQAA